MKLTNKFKDGIRDCNKINWGDLRTPAAEHFGAVDLEAREKVINGHNLTKADKENILGMISEGVLKDTIAFKYRIPIVFVNYIITDARLISERQLKT